MKLATLVALALALALLATPAALACDKSTCTVTTTTTGEWTVPMSLLWMPGYTSSFAWGEPDERPQIDAKVHGTLGMAAGLGYRFANGFTLMGQALYTRTDVDARWVLPDFTGAVLERSADRSNVGFMVTFEVPLGGK